MRIISWNVNGIRSNIVDFNTAKYKDKRQILENSPIDNLIKNYNPDLICFQETRLGEDNYKLFDSDNINSKFPYRYWSSSKGEGARSGNRYSGTAIWSKIKPESVVYDIPEMNDREGRIVQLNFKDIVVITSYTPNAGSNWDYRLTHWEPVLQKYLSELSNTGKKVVYCGDFNIANKTDVWFGNLLEKKFAEEKDNQIKHRYKKTIKSKTPLHTGVVILAGYSVQERKAYSDLLLASNMVDCFRFKNPDTIDQFSYFNIRIKGSFKNNVGWLIDRFIIPQVHQDSISRCEIVHTIGVRNEDGNMISDHIPIFLEIS